MDPVTLILAALAAGIAKGAGDTAAQTVKDGYVRLKTAIEQKFAGNARAEQALRELEVDPDASEAKLAEHLRETRADQDTESKAAAESLLAEADRACVKTKYHVVVQEGGKIGIVGDHTSIDTLNM